MVTRDYEANVYALFPDLEARTIEVRKFSHPNFVRDLVLDRELTRILTACDDGVARLIDIESGGLVAAADAGHALVGVRFGSGGDFFATIDSLGLVRLWSRDGKELGRLVHEGVVKGVAFSPDDRFALTWGDFDGGITARIWDLDSIAALVRQRFLHDGPVLHVAFSPDGNLLLTGDREGLKIWDASSARLLARGSVPGVELTPSAVEFVDRSRVRVALGERGLAEWHWNENRWVEVVPRDDVTLPAGGEAAGFADDGTRLVVVKNIMGIDDAPVGLDVWQDGVGFKEVTLQAGRRLLAIDPAASTIVWGGAAGLGIASILDGAAGVTWPGAPPPDMTAAIDSTTMVLGRGAKLSVWRKGSPERERDLGKRILAISASPKGDVVAVLTDDARLRVIDIASLSDLSERTVDRMLDDHRLLRFSDDGEVLAVVIGMTSQPLLSWPWADLGGHCVASRRRRVSGARPRAAT